MQRTDVGTISVNKALQRADKVALSKIDPTQIYHTFPDRREGSKSSLILKRTKTKKSNRVLYMTKPLKEELLAWLDKMKQDEQNAPWKRHTATAVSCSAYQTAYPLPRTF